MHFRDDDSNEAIFPLLLRCANPQTSHTSYTKVVFLHFFNFTEKSVKFEIRENPHLRILFMSIFFRESLLASFFAFIASPNIIFFLQAFRRHYRRYYLFTIKWPFLALR